MNTFNLTEKRNSRLAKKELREKFESNLKEFKKFMSNDWFKKDKNNIWDEAMMQLILNVGLKTKTPVLDKVNKDAVVALAGTWESFLNEFGKTISHDDLDNYFSKVLPSEFHTNEKIYNTCHTPSLIKNPKQEHEKL